MNKPLLNAGALQLKQCRYGPMLYLTTDKYIGQAYARYGEYSEGEAFFFRQLIQPTWTVLDVGANHGSHTIVFAKAAKIVHAFEPQRILFQILNANVGLNALTNVHTYQVGVGRVVGTINVPTPDYTQDNNFGACSLGGIGEVVPLITIDSLHLDSCDFIKIDVESMEGDVIAGAKQTIIKHHPLIYLENDRGEKSATLIQQLFDLDYRLYWHLPYYFNVHNYFGVPESENIYGSTISINMLAVHESQVAPAGLREVLSSDDTWRPPILPPREAAIAKSTALGALLTPVEQAALWDLAMDAVPVGGLAIEVGTWSGGSAAIIGEVCRIKKAQLICVDLFDPTFTGATPLDRTRQALHGLPIMYVVGDSVKVAGILAHKQADFIFLDGGHHMPVIELDIIGYREILKPNGTYCGHDYGRFDVTDAVNRNVIVTDFYGSIWVNT